MSIRKTLLLAFLAVGLIPAAVLGWLAFDRASTALQGEIESGLAAQADALQADVTRLMFERLQNAATWRRLEVMQDLKVADVDRRLSAFLQRLAQGYGGLYRALSAVDASGTVVASSEAARIGRAAPAGTARQNLRLGDTPVGLDGPDREADEATEGLTLRTPVPSAFGDEVLGELRLRIDLAALDLLLEQAARGGRHVVLLDAQGRVLAGSAALRRAIPRGHDALEGLAAARGPLAGTVVLSAWPGLPMFVGASGGSAVAGFDGLGWRVRVLVPRDEALAPVRQMASIFGLLLAAVAVTTLLAAFGVSHAIARPVIALTRFARGYRHGQTPPRPPTEQRGEVGELGRAFVDMVRDIEQQQQQLSRASALAAVGEMSAVIAHEVRTPLGIVLSSAQVLQREDGLSAEGRELVGFIESETARLGRLVAQMLDSTRPRPPQPAPTDLHALIEHALALLVAQAAKQGVEVETRFAARPDPVECDAEQMTQVLLNLVVNGLQILGDGGRIEVGTADEPDDRVRIDVADDGPGIAPEARTRIFEAFHFQREGGIGLGLAVVHQIVAAHGGTVEAAESTLGGALFTIRLPRRQKTRP